MTDVLLFHHAQGLTDGVREFAGTLRAAGHNVTLPDLYDGRTFATRDDGVAEAGRIGVEEILERGRRAALDLPGGIVYAGFSLGVLPAQLLAQTRLGALGALLFESCVAPSDLGTPWPARLPAQIHVMDRDPVAIEGGDLANAQDLAASFEGVELLLYPGDQHLFADPSLPSFDRGAAALLMRRTLDFLASLSTGGHPRDDPQRDTPGL